MKLTRIPQRPKKLTKQQKKIFGVYTPHFMSPKSTEWQGWKKRICICVPVTGLVRVEWMMARFGQVVPVNWSNGDIFQFFNQFSPMGWAVADARNFCVEYSLKQGFEWTFFIDHDVCLPPDTFLKITEYMSLLVEDHKTGKQDRSKSYPVVSGLYYCKGSHPEPLLFRGRGNSYFGKWKRGEKVMVDGIPMGCALIHNDILRVLHAESETYTMPTQGGPAVVRRVFETPRHAWFDPETGNYNTKVGTEDLFWCDRIRSTGTFKKAGWKQFEGKKYPFLLDTSIFSQHIDEQGIRYPANIGIT